MFYLTMTLIASLAWSVFDLKRKQLVQHTSALALSFWLTIAVIPVYVLWIVGLDIPWPETAYWLPGLASLIVSTVAVVAFVRALKIGEIALLMPVLSLAPVVSSLLAWVLTGEVLSQREMLAMAVIVGIIFLLQGGWQFKVRKGFGLMCVVACGWGTGTAFDNLAVQSAEPVMHAFLQCIGIGVLLGTGLLIRDQRIPKAPAAIPLIIATLLFCMAVVSQFYALIGMHPGVVETVKRGIGMLGAVIWGVWLFGERVRSWQLALIGLLVLSIAVLMWP